MEYAPFVRVQWLWLIYPGVIIVGSLRFLLHTIVRGARRGVGVEERGAADAVLSG